MSYASSSNFDLKFFFKGELSITLIEGPPSVTLRTGSSDTVSIVSFILIVSSGCKSRVDVSYRVSSTTFDFPAEGITGTDLNRCLRVAALSFTGFLDDWFKLSFSLACSFSVAASGCIGFITCFSFFSSRAIALSGSSLIKLGFQTNLWMFDLELVICSTSIFFSYCLRALICSASSSPLPSKPEKSSRSLSLSCSSLSYSSGCDLSIRRFPFSTESVRPMTTLEPSRSILLFDIDKCNLLTRASSLACS